MFLLLTLRLLCLAAPDIPSTPPTTIAYVSSKIPPSLSAPAGNTTFTFLGAARSTHVSAEPLAEALAAHKAAADPTVAATLLPTHVEAWRETWSQSIIEFEGDDFVKRAINSTLCEI